MTQYYRLFVDAWRFFRRYAEQIPLSDPAWEAAIEELNSVLIRHDSIQRMARRMMSGVVDELEHLDREAKGQE